MNVLAPGLIHYSNYLGKFEKEFAIKELRKIALHNKPYQPMTPFGKRMSISITSAGTYGWSSDENKYFYSEVDPQGKTWLPIPEIFLDIWAELLPQARKPDSLLLNIYKSNTKLGLHQDLDEKDFSQPILSLSFGFPANFAYLIFSNSKQRKRHSLKLHSGDVLVMSEESRNLFHGVESIETQPNSVDGLNCRLNVTMRVSH